MGTPLLLSLILHHNLSRMEWRGMLLYTMIAAVIDAGLHENPRISVTVSR
jgi:hypothetical protein